MSNSSSIYTVTPFIFSTLSLCCFLFGVGGSAISLLYFLDKFRQKKSTSTLLFILMNISDGTICFLILFVGISEIMSVSGNTSLFTCQWFCDIWGVCWYVAARMSIFFIAFLSISRTWVVIHPLAVIEKRKILGTSGVYLALMLAQQTFVFWLGKHYSYERGHGHCAIDPFEVFPPHSAEIITMNTKIFFVVFVIVENVFPWVLVVLSCFITIRSLRRSRMIQHQYRTRVEGRLGGLGGGCRCGCAWTMSCGGQWYVWLVYYLRCGGDDTAENTQLRGHGDVTQLRGHGVFNQDCKKTATVTILILTIVYLILNTFSIVIYILDSVEIFSNDVIRLYSNISEDELGVILMVAWLHTISLNSLSNVAVYFCRLTSLRQYTVNLFPSRGVLHEQPSVVVQHQQHNNVQRSTLLDPSLITIL